MSHLHVSDFFHVGAHHALDGHGDRLGNSHSNNREEENESKRAHHEEVHEVQTSESQNKKYPNNRKKKKNGPCEGITHILVSTGCWLYSERLSIYSIDFSKELTLSAFAPKSETPMRDSDCICIKQPVESSK